MSAAVEGRVTVANALGVHARPASALVLAAGAFPCTVTVAKGQIEVNAKSIMGVLMLAAEQGSELVFRAEGERAREAVDTLVGLVSRGFDLVETDE